MQALLTAIVVWLSVNFGLPANYQHPRIEFVPADSIAALHSQNFPPEQRTTNTAMVNAKRDIVAIYGSEADTIYLPERWSGSTPDELSMLVHEMVHHLQKKGNLKYECSQERERVAYEAQDQWLRLFKGNLEANFKIDPLMRLMLTNCMIP
jgi:hypothetical protein